MLKQLRNKKTSKRILWVLAIIIIPAFVFWGAGSAIRNKRKTNFAGKIFGKKISFSDYDNAFLAAKNQAILQYGTDILKVAQFLEFSQLAWNRIILLHETKKRKIKINDKEVITAIKNMPMFNRDGVFNQEIYEYILRYLKTTARDFEENTRDSLKVAKLYEDITNSTNITKQELETGYKKLHEQAQVEYISISDDNYRKEVLIEEDEIKNYFIHNKEDFRRPVSVSIEYLGLDYPENASEQEKFNTQADFNELTSKISKPSDFEKIAEDKGLVIKETDFFDPEQPVPEIGWSKEFTGAAFNLTGKDISTPIDTAKGIYLLRLKEKKESYLPELIDIKDRIIDLLTGKKAHIIAGQKAQEFLTQIKQARNQNPAALSEISRKLNLETKKTPLFKHNTYIKGIGMSEEFSNSAFGLEKNNISQVIEMPKAFYILGFVQFIGIDQEKFEQEKKEFSINLLKQKEEQTFADFLQELKKEANLVNYIPSNYQTK